MDRVSELSNISRPGIPTQKLLGILGKPNSLVGARSGLIDEFAREEHNIGPAFPQRGNLNTENIQAVEEVFPELPFPDHALKVPVRCRNDAHIRLPGNARPKGTKLLLLQEAQQLRLEVERYFANLVQEYGAPTGGFDDTGAVAISSREGATDRAEHLGFPQCARYGA